MVVIMEKYIMSLEKQLAHLSKSADFMLHLCAIGNELKAERLSRYLIDEFYASKGFQQVIWEAAICGFPMTFEDGLVNVRLEGPEDLFALLYPYDT